MIRVATLCRAGEESSSFEIHCKRRIIVVTPEQDPKQARKEKKVAETLNLRTVPFIHCFIHIPFFVSFFFDLQTMAVTTYIIAVPF